jgi:tRNA pseudouridine55 synthase
VATRATEVARNRRGNPIHGWLVIDKPVGMTSMQAVSRVRRATGAAKAGHAGTLDPLASGVLPVALGEATKTVPFVTGGKKRYRFTACWGEARSTDDAEGEVVATSAVRPTREQICVALERMIGAIEQVPPAFSAVHIGGQRAYALARAGHKVDPSPRMVAIHRFALVDRPNDDHAVFEVECGKGTYIRSLARDMAVALGTVGHVSALRRTAVEPFTEAQAISLESLQSLGHSPAAFGQLLPVETALDDIPALALTDTEANRLRCGQPVGLLSRQDLERVGHLESGSIVCAMAGGKPVALARFEAGDLRAVRVLNL